MRVAAPAILDRFGFRQTLVIGTLLNAVCFFILGFIQTLNYALLIPLLMVAGFVQALVFTGINGLVFAQPTEKEMGRATALSAISQQVGLTLGISVAALVLQVAGGFSAQTSPYLSHFSWAFWSMALVLLLATWSLLGLRKGEAIMLHHQPRHDVLQHERV